MTTTSTITSNTSNVTLTSPTYSDPVTIASGVLVNGITAVSAQTSWTIQNFGTLSGSNTNGDGVHLGDGGSITNANSATITGYIGLNSYARAATVDNSGHIYGQQNGVSLGAGGSITNEAHGSIGAGEIGVYLEQGGSVTNENGGTITGIVGIRQSYNAGTAAAVNNFGRINGTGGGVYLKDGGSVTNEATGSISAGGGDGVYISLGTARVVNDGKITSTDNYGVYLYNGTSGTVENAGTIVGGGAISVYLKESGTNRLIVDPGAKFTGIVEAVSGAANTIELKTGSSVGTISGLGAQYTGFKTVTIDSGAAWNIAGTKAGVAASTIQGFNSHDRLDLTDLTFNSGDTATVNASNQLIITDAGGNVTIQMDSGVHGHLFTLVNDGSGHTFAEESNYTPCYLRGTRVRTPKGEVAVEALRIGDRVVTADGVVLPIKWIGRRSYRDWLAVGNPDVQPILFKVGSIADHIPARDLYVSPEHAMFLDGLLIPALHLVNGISILKVEGLEEIEYFHLEFDRHVVIFAEGAAAESFVDDDSRMLFHNAGEYRRLYPEEPRGRFAEFCAPRVEDGYALEKLRRTLAARAPRLQPSGKAVPIRQDSGVSSAQLGPWSKAGPSPASMLNERRSRSW